MAEEEDRVFKGQGLTLESTMIKIRRDCAALGPFCAITEREVYR